MVSTPVILASAQAEVLLAAHASGMPETTISPDLGISHETVKLSDSGVTFAIGEHLDWARVEKIARSEINCFQLEDGDIHAIQYFSEDTSRMCSLMPTRGAPTMLIAGFTMHRIVDIDPMQDTRKKMETLKPVVGRVLDTTTGLGYTAITAAHTAEHVTTIEFDPGAQYIARRNPWSRELFDNPKIQQMMGDAYEIVPSFAENSFDRIVHDPPVFSLAGQLYSATFYRELYRVLKKGGRLFHYIGNLESKSSGTVARGAFKRLQEAGFKRVVRRPEAFGILAYK
ncbi:class I SAM-dependent methyltransferase [Ktedonospora formicarum]|uniref:SAM-dependent methyltransferase n=1 Tax=Ktedonospora formicarum TaxID=2778364 RepID=A0A8J3MQX6_9CHLR|nr:methyltransferase domain-containing protein [Ktedonospora formicarum]GHO44425.1 SAM-dependent methyltransferase [Ktedonospora formicarum]